MTGATPKRKGSAFEREIVRACDAAGLRAERAWGNDGRALVTDDGTRCTSDVDLLIEGRLKLQAKRRRRVAQWAKPPQGAHVTALREDRGEAVVVVPLGLFLRLLRRVYHRRPENALLSQENAYPGGCHG